MKRLDKKWKRGIWITLILIVVVLCIIFREVISDFLTPIYYHLFKH